MRIEIVGAGWERSGELERLLFDVLYRDFGVGFDDEWRHLGPFGSLAVATGEAGALLGTARLLSSPGDAERQLRQLAVLPDARGRGVGRELVQTVERVAREEGATAVVLNARDSAFAFYERLGYRFTGPEFVSELTGIPHRPMRHDLLG